ncbi:RNA-directed DNA polymerase, eukaryota, reverse transcriptase zinc-binding domain protein [Tanacetum coccineum]
MTKLELFQLRSMWGNFNFDYVCSMARGMSGGLVTIWDPNVFAKKRIWCGNNYIIVEGKWKNSLEDYIIINVYGSQYQPDKSNLRSMLRMFIHSNNGRVILFGDLNEVRSESERFGSIFSSGDATIFNFFIHTVGLIDLPMGGRKFTWVVTLDRLWSDHNPILLHCKRNDFGPIPFKIFHSWFVRIDKRIDDGIATDIKRNIRINKMQELDNFEKLELMDLVQKSRVKWEVKGDENKKFFHGLINSRRKSQLVQGNMLEGVWITDPKVMVSLDEINTAVWDCGSQKALGPDGYSYGPLILNEIIDWYKKRKKNLMLFKVDFEKAFDTMSLRYLDFVLDNLGFGIKWRTWIKAGLVSARTSILVNGSPTLEFSLKRGLRQWDPLSPFLFLIIMEGFHMTLHDGLAANMFHGVKDVKLILIYRFKARLPGWNANLLSVGGRLTLIKSVLGSLGIYYFSLFKALETIVKALESFRASFFWGGSEDSKKLAWVKWSNILASLDKGGLSVGSLKAFKFSLLLKWRWRLFQYQDALSVHVIQAIHGEEAGIDIRGCQTNGVWASIVGSIYLLHSSGIVPFHSIRFKIILSDIVLLTALGHGSGVDRLMLEDRRLKSMLLFLILPTWRRMRLLILILAFGVFDIAITLFLLYLQALDGARLSCGAVFTLGLVLRSRSFPPVTIGTSGCSLNMLQTSRRTMLIQSSRLLVGPSGVLEIISL